MTTESHTKRNHDIVVVGGSSGGVEALKRLIPQLPFDLPASIVVVIHRAPSNKDLLASLLQKYSQLPVQLVDQKLPLERRKVYIASGGRHLVLRRGEIELVAGPKENLARPSIDVLFRSAAEVYGPQVIGVLLTGLLDDGTLGLTAIKRAGGIAVVQDPADADYPDMPRNAQRRANPEYSVPLKEMGDTIVKLVHTPARKEKNVSPEVWLENKMVGEEVNPVYVEKWGTPVPLVCPECGGPIYIGNEPIAETHQFRCRIGHSFTTISLLQSQKNMLEKNLWQTIVNLEQMADLLTTLAEEGRSRSDESTREKLMREAGQLRSDSVAIQNILKRDIEFF